MKKTLLVITTLGLLSVFAIAAFYHFIPEKKKLKNKDGYKHLLMSLAADEDEWERTADPTTHTIPTERLVAAYEQLKAMEANTTATSFDATAATWQERGPNNVGGRTRALMIDPNDPTRKTVWAGSVGGGLWKNTDVATN